MIKNVQHTCMAAQSPSLFKWVVRLLILDRRVQRDASRDVLSASLAMAWQYNGIAMMNYEHVTS